MEKPREKKPDSDSTSPGKNYLFLFFSRRVSDGLFNLFSFPHGTVFWERTAEGLDVFRLFCRGPECVNVECTKKKSPTHNAEDCVCDNGAIVAGLSIVLCLPTGSWWCQTVRSTINAQLKPVTDLWVACAPIVPCFVLFSPNLYTMYLQQTYKWLQKPNILGVKGFLSKELVSLKVTARHMMVVLCVKNQLLKRTSRFKNPVYSLDFLQSLYFKSTSKLSLCFQRLLSLKALPRSCLGSEGTRRRFFFVYEENRLCFWRTYNWQKTALVLDNGISGIGVCFCRLFGSDTGSVSGEHYLLWLVLFLENVISRYRFCSWRTYNW